MAWRDQKMIEYFLLGGVLITLVLTFFLVRQADSIGRETQVPHLIAVESAEEEKKVIHCWEDHPEAPLECICKSGRKEAGEPCVLNRH